MIFLLNKQDKEILEKNRKKITEHFNNYTIYTDDEINNFYIDLIIGSFFNDEIIISDNLTFEQEDQLSKFELKIDKFSNFYNKYIYKPGLFDKLKNIRNKKSEEENYEFFELQETRIFNPDLINKQNFIKYLIDNNYLTIEQLKEVQQKVDRDKNMNINSHIIEIARKKGFISDTDSAKILTNIYSKKFLSKSSLNLENLYIINKPYLKTGINFLIKNYDKDTNTLTIIYDNETNPNLYIIEDRYVTPIIEREFLVEGVLEEIKRELIEYGKRH